MNVNIYYTEVYENISDWTLGENKPNSNPIKPNCRKGVIYAKCVFTKDYVKNDDFTVRINKPNFVKGPKLAQTSLLQRIMKMKPPSGPKKTNPNKPNFKGKKLLLLLCEIAAQHKKFLRNF